MAKDTIKYESKKVALSRVYPFGEIAKARVRGVERDVTVVTVQELTGEDDENLLKQKNQSIYSEISVACGLTIEEAKKLTRADAMLIQEVMQGFLYDSAEIELID